ncbi:hypothetical protein SAMN04488127_2926 [Bhargavaea ginsengi]|uniref:DUF3990 domain-containing protein n=1 Tax=Bhargavaea ginsengi TaxID=426757 RepID=A0A1H7BY08_9BACL|nr:hypothetical protein [Bhargavaea ginsengi]SEJ82469.1 hypothetical protein SAMN04488127_2926 [Bhargavaea ginsengi]
MRDLDFYAYHGTSDTSAKKIVASQSFIIKGNRTNHWLGDGFYLYREDYKQASVWAQTKYRFRKNVKPTVLEARINAPFNKVLHLDTREGIESLARFLSHVREEILFEPEEDKISAHFVFSMMDPEYVWAIIKTFTVQSRPIDENKRLKQLSFIHNEEEISYRLQGTQVCVKNSRAIVDSSIQEVAMDKQAKLTMTKKVVKEDDFPWKFQ